jgi:tRNA/tmRNA/rRNA uracil-C5-methylase (TrmA/RlmC/RlmD family)
LHQVNPDTPSSIVVQIKDLSRGGSGVANLETGEIVFVPFTMPGDHVRIKITEKKKNYAQAELLEVISPSPQRVTPFCPVFQRCGGCLWQHVPYAMQFQTKQSGVIHALKRAGLSDVPAPALLPAERTEGYRNRVQLRGDPAKKQMGYFARGSNELVAIDHCPIARPEINAILPDIRAKGFQEMKRPFKVEIEVRDDGHLQTAWNQGHAAFGFRQVHSEQNEKLRNWVKAVTVETLNRHHAKKPSQNRRLFDLFGGSGNLSLQLAADFTAVDCVDLSTPKQPPIGTPEHYRFHRSPVREWIEKAATKAAPAHESTIFVMDPPREGLGTDFAMIVQSILVFQPIAVLLVGCDADSFARDVFRFTQHHFKLEKLAILDLFPHTPHVESLALLTLNP